MSGFGVKSLTFILLICFFVWCSSLELCNARRGRHWRHSKDASASLYKKKANSHGGTSHNNHGFHGSTSKPKPSKPIKQPKVPSPPHKGHSPAGQLPPTPPAKGNTGDQSTVFNVLDFGAKGDGKTDDTKAFEAAWEAACKVARSTVMVPSEFVFFVGPVSFSGPYCQQDIVFQLEGTIIAPTSSKAWGSGLYQWILFSKLKGLTIRGGGVIDGRGSVWWQDDSLADPVDDETRMIIPIDQDPVHNSSQVPVSNGEVSGKMPSLKPTALRFYGSFDVMVTGIKIQNSPQCHLKFDNCIGVEVFDMSVSSPGDSLNTDGIHLQNSKDVLIHSNTLACGDDCISIQTGCSNIYIHDVNCGPGHGISIGGLGKDNTKACVSNITVRDVMMHNTMTGVRIKTWQGGSGSVQGVFFSNIQVSEVQLPIVIDQFYCDKSTCKNQTAAVALSGINYERIRGTYTVKPVHFACSDSLPCTDVTLTAIELKPIQEKYHLYEPFCWQTFGELSTPTVPPISCLQIGKPSSNRIQSDHDYC